MLAGPANAAWTTFGDTSPGASTDTLTANLKEVSKYTGVQGNLVRVTAYLSVRFLVRFFETNRLTPFAAYCTGAGTVCLAIFLVT